MLIINKEEKDGLLYIHYKDIEEAKKEIEKFAFENAKKILRKLVCARM